jgi:hypothetical protein
MAEWISVKDRLPEEGKPVLISDGKDGTAAKMQFFYHVITKEKITSWEPHCAYHGEAWIDFEPTHWMPLPEPPKS